MIPEPLGIPTPDSHFKGIAVRMDVLRVLGEWTPIFGFVCRGTEGKPCRFFSKQVHCRIRMGSMKTSAQQLGRRDVFFFCGGNLSPQKYHS